MGLDVMIYKVVGSDEVIDRIASITPLPCNLDTRKHFQFDTDQNLSEVFYSRKEYWLLEWLQHELGVYGDITHYLIGDVKYLIRKVDKGIRYVNRNCYSELHWLETNTYRLALKHSLQRLRSTLSKQNSNSQIVICWVS